MLYSEINAGLNKSSLEKASRQEKQLSYFSQSKIQESVLSEEQVKLWAEKNAQTDDYFLNYIKSIFLTENFQFFSKYLRFPLPSARIIKNKIEPQLNRVFVSDNSYFAYEGGDKETHDLLDVNDFEIELFNRYLYAHNSIVVSDIKDGEPYRYFVNISDVISISHDNKNITSILFKGILNDEAVKIYIDQTRYAVFVNGSEYSAIDNQHDLGYCPTYFITPVMDNDFVIRRSIFSYIREDLENYVFYSVLSKMTNSNGVLPIVSVLDAQVDSGNSSNQNSVPGQPDSSYIVGSQAPSLASGITPKTSQTSGLLQPGSVNSVPLLRKDDGSIDMDAVKYYINFHYLPVENVKYLNEQIKEIENRIVSTIIGDIVSADESSKNEMQVGKSVIVLENTLIAMADDFNEIRKCSDKAMLDLYYGVDVVEPEIFYGTSFFLQTESELMDQFAKAPNPLERRNILAQVNRNKFKNNHELKERASLLYKLIPFVSDIDYKESQSKALVDAKTTILYLQFDKWINVFESKFGNIVEFYENISDDENVALKVINDLLYEIVDNVGVDTDKQPLAVYLGVGATQSLQLIITDPIMSEQSKISTINVLFGISIEDATRMVGTNKTIIT